MNAIVEPLLVVQGAVKRFALRRRSLKRTMAVALDGVDLTVDRGQTVAVVGESGSGKSTLGRAILHLIRLDAGRILFEGREIQDLDEAAFRPLRAELQMVFQNPAASFDPMMTIGDTLVDAMHMLQGVDREEKYRRAMRYLSEMQLNERFAGLYPYEMSGGQLQRVALARALVPEPKLIFLDEPTAALDMSIRGQIINLLMRLQERQRLAFIFISHDLRVVRYVADHVLVMYLGEVVESAPKAPLFRAPRHPYTQALLAATHVAAGDRRLGLHGEVAGIAGSGCRLAQRCPHAVARCRVERQELRTIAPDHAVRCWRAEELAIAAPLATTVPTTEPVTRSIGN